MIIMPDERRILCIGITIKKRVVNSECGNPTAVVELECFDSLPSLINNNTGARVFENVSSMCDLTSSPSSFNDIEAWLINNSDMWKGGRHEPT